MPVNLRNVSADHPKLVLFFCLGRSPSPASLGAGASAVQPRAEGSLPERKPAEGREAARQGGHTNKREQPEPVVKNGSMTIHQGLTSEGFNGGKPTLTVD